MIIVRFELWSAVTKEVSVLGTVTVDNTGGTFAKRNYRIRAFPKGVTIPQILGGKTRTEKQS